MRGPTGQPAQFCPAPGSKNRSGELPLPTAGPSVQGSVLPIPKDTLGGSQIREGGTGAVSRETPPLYQVPELKVEWSGILAAGPAPPYGTPENIDPAFPDSVKKRGCVRSSRNCDRIPGGGFSYPAARDRFG